MKSLTRRRVLRGIGAIALAPAGGGAVAPAAAATDQGLLAKLRAAKKVRVGIANNPPFSALNPDGTLTGAAPAISLKIMERLGVPEMEGFIANYGELIPGMMADRWDFVSAALAITQARCTQVKFADPIIFDGTALVYLKETTAPAPTKIADLAKRDVALAVLTGGADLRATIAAGISPGNILQFDNDMAVIDALLAKRAPYALEAHSRLQDIFAQRNIELEVVYPLPDDPVRGSSSAFRTGDTDLYEAYQRELQAMKASGEYLAIIRQFGYDTPAELIKMTAEQACAA